MRPRTERNLELELAKVITFATERVVAAVPCLDPRQGRRSRRVGIFVDVEPANDPRADAAIIEAANFRLPDSDISSPTFNHILAAQAPRQVQFALKFMY